MGWDHFAESDCITILNAYKVSCVREHTVTCTDMCMCTHVN